MADEKQTQNPEVQTYPKDKNALMSWVAQRFRAAGVVGVMADHAVTEIGRMVNGAEGNFAEIVNAVMNTTDLAIQAVHQMATEKEVETSKKGKLIKLIESEFEMQQQQEQQREAERKAIMGRVAVLDQQWEKDTKSLDVLRDLSKKRGTWSTQKMEEMADKDRPAFVDHWADLQADIILRSAIYSRAEELLKKYKQEFLDAAKTFGIEAENTDELKKKLDKMPPESLSDFMQEIRKKVEGKEKEVKTQKMEIDTLRKEDAQITTVANDRGIVLPPELVEQKVEIRRQLADVSRELVEQAKVEYRQEVVKEQENQQDKSIVDSRAEELCELLSKWTEVPFSGNTKEFLKAFEQGMKENPEWSEEVDIVDNYKELKTALAEKKPVEKTTAPQQERGNGKQEQYSPHLPKDAKAEVESIRETWQQKVTNQPLPEGKPPVNRGGPQNGFNR